MALEEDMLLLSKIMKSFLEPIGNPNPENSSQLKKFRLSIEQCKASLLIHFILLYAGRNTLCEPMSSNTCHTRWLSHKILVITFAEMEPKYVWNMEIFVDGGMPFWVVGPRIDLSKIAPLSAIACIYVLLDFDK